LRGIRQLAETEAISRTVKNNYNAMMARIVRYKYT